LDSDVELGVVWRESIEAKKNNSRVKRKDQI